MTPNLSVYAGIKPEKFPRIWFPCYVVYKYSWWKNTHIVGCDTEEIADRLQKEYLTHKDISRCEIFGHFPLELLKEQ